MPAKRFSYTAKFKLYVVKFAEEHGGNRAAGREFGVNEKLVRDWRKAQDTLRDMTKTFLHKKNHGTGWNLYTRATYTRANTVNATQKMFLKRRVFKFFLYNDDTCATRV
jgi:transposase-like protein